MCLGEGWVYPWGWVCPERGEYSGPMSFLGVSLVPGGLGMSLGDNGYVWGVGMSMGLGMSRGGESTHSPDMGDTVGKRAVRILLECCLVYCFNHC